MKRVILCSTKWMGKYLGLDKKWHRFYSMLDTHNGDEASEMLEQIIPEAYSNYVFLGSAPSGDLSKDGFKEIKCSSCLGY